MRGQTFIVSVAAHAAAFAVISRCTLALDLEVQPVGSTAPRVELVPVDLTPVEKPPVEVVYLDETEPAEAPPIAAPAARVGRSASSTASIATTTAEPTESPHEPPTTTGALAMRGRRHDLALSSESAARIVGGKTETATEAPADPRWAHDPKIKLVPNGGGKTEIRDRVAKFHVAPDGTIHNVEDAPDFSIKLNLPSPSKIKSLIVRELDAWNKDPYRATRVGSMQDLPRHLQAAEGACQQWNDPMCRTAEDWQEQFRQEDEAVGEGALISGTADITGYLHRKFVGDPYASRKLKILDQTRDERARLGAEHRGEQQDRAAELVQKNLVSLWRRVSDPAERRAALFALWDECTEGEGEAGAAGARARSMVIGWIRLRLPAGSPGAFSADDIARLDAKRSSRQHFTPY